MQNAHPQIMLNMVRELSPGTQFPHLEMYCANYDAWRSFLADYLGTSKDATRIEITKLCYGERPIAEIPIRTNST